MSQPQYHSFSAADGVGLRAAVFRAEPERALLVFYNGQGEFIEKYLETYAALNARGFSVATFDWRGQGGSQRALADPFVGHVGDFAEYDLDAAAFLTQVVRPLTEAPVPALGHSMGGHMLLRSLRTKPALFSAAVLNAPMLKFRTRGTCRPLALGAIALHGALGYGTHYAWGMKKRDPMLEPFAHQLATSDRARHARGQAFLRDRPDLRIFGPSWGWLNAAQRAIGQITAEGFAEAIKTPVLIVGAGHDRVCHSEAARAYATRLPNGAYVEIPGAEHEILRERDCFQEQFWRAFDGFIEN